MLINTKIICGKKSQKLGNDGYLWENWTNEEQR